VAGYFSKYGISATMSLPITDEVSAHVGPDLRGVLLGLVEVYQRQERWEDAIACLERLERLEPDDVVVKLSLAELLLDARPGDKNVCRKIVRLAEGIENETPVHTALLLYKARALRGRSGTNGPWSTRTSASAGGRAASSRSSTPRTRITRMLRPGWDCSGNPHQRRFRPFEDVSLFEKMLRINVLGDILAVESGYEEEGCRRGGVCDELSLRHEARARFATPSARCLRARRCRRARSAVSWPG